MTGVMDDTCGPVHHAPGPALAAALSAVDTATLDDRALAEHVAATERLLAWAASLQLCALADFARRPLPDDVGRAATAVRAGELGAQVREYAADELAPRLRASSRSVQSRIDLACSLVHLPRTNALLASGRIDLARARVMADETASLDSDAATGVDEHLAERAAALTPAQLRRVVRRAVLALDPAGAHDRELRAVRGRHVSVRNADDGMAELFALLPAPDALRIHGVLTAHARAVRGQDGDERTLDQLRADAFGAVFREAADSRELLGQKVGESCELQVTVAATTLLGLDDAPGELRGYGPITAEVVRALAPGSRLRRLITDPLDHTVLDVGRTSYAPTAAIVRHVRTRHPRCTFPTCGQPAFRCELDHAVPFPDGPTGVDNLRPRCKRHHLLKHHPAVRVEELPDGSTRWTLPTGVHENEPEPPLPPPF